MHLSNFATVCLFVCLHHGRSFCAYVLYFTLLFVFYWVQIASSIAVLYLNVRLSHNKRLLTYLILTYLLTHIDLLLACQPATDKFTS